MFTKTTIALTIVLSTAATALAATKHQTYRPSAQVECANPGAHIWCAPAPSHLNDAAQSATGF